MKLGIVNTVLPLLFSTFRQTTLQQWPTRFYSPTYLKEVNKFMLQIRTFPKLSANTLSSIKGLGIAKHRRGCRSGKQVKSKHGRCNLHIPTRIQNNYTASHGRVTRTINNLTKINLASRKKDNANLQFVPSIGLSNVMSLAPKIDEVKIFLAKQNLDLLCITETWLKDSITDSVIDINNYDVFRKDRTSSQHGGVCAYIKDSIKSTRLQELEDPNGCEALWIKLSPTRLPRGYSCLIVGVIYHPPSANDELLMDYLLNTLSNIECEFPNAGLLITGDFNRADTKQLKDQFRLSQTVNFPTRGERTLDLILTNLGRFYVTPQRFSPFGLSDHCTVLMCPKQRDKDHPSSKCVSVRDKKPSSKQALGRYLSESNWSSLTEPSNTQDKYSYFNTIVQIGLDTICPTKKIRIHRNDPPWITTKFKSLITLRQKAFTSNNETMFKFYRNKVNRERKQCKAKYYQAKVNHLSQTDSKKWWSECRRLCGMVKSASDLAPKLLAGSTPTKENMLSLANNINDGFLEPQQDFDPLSPDFCVDTNEASVPFVTVDTVEKCLSSVSISKAGGPDDIPNWILKEFSYELAIPVCHIINSSLTEGTLPTIWKHANVTPIPKTAKINDVKTDLRPISLTPTLSKVAEHLIVQYHIKPAVLRRLGTDQFGCIPKSSTTHALINLIHSWTSVTDGKSNDVRAFIMDFKKAFDLIDHNLLMAKLCSYDINPYIINWIANFISNRFQRIKLANDCLSQWKTVKAGVPQGTKLGPWLFIVMIDDLNIPSAEDVIKYVDDTTFYEIVSRKSPSIAQTSINEICTWSTENKFLLHPKKSKELRISFARTQTTRNNVTINGNEIKPVTSVKILGVTLQNDLKWNSHITEIISKAAKRLYFITQLKRASVGTGELLKFYTACVRSVLLYACQVFHYSLPDYLSNSLERIQKRALRIIYGYDLHYSEALSLSGLETLYECRQRNCTNFFQKIVSNKDDKLHHLLPFISKKPNISLRKQRLFEVPISKTNRHKNSFIIAGALNHDNIN